MDSPLLTPIIAAANRDALPNGIPVRSPATIRRIITRTAEQAYEAGHDAAVGDLLTPPQVAEILGIDRSRVLRLAKSRGVGWRFGRDWLFRPADVDAMRERKPGRPTNPRKGDER